MDNSQGITLFDAENQMKLDGENAVFKRVQHVDDSLLSRLSDSRFASSQAPMGDLHHVASIPTVIVEKWMAEGFNIFDKNINVRDIVKRLQSEDMGMLMATTRRI